MKAKINNTLVKKLVLEEKEYAAQQDVLNYISMFYNCYRLHSYLGYMNPNQFEREWGKMKKVA